MAASPSMSDPPTSLRLKDMAMIETTTENRATTATRSVVLVDLENLVGTTLPTRREVANLRNALTRAAGIQPGDEVILATSHVTARFVWFQWPGVRRLVRSGVDGADLALLDAIREEQLADRFDRVVIASGDGIFADACAELDAAGCRVLVISRPGALSRRLAAVAPELALLDDPSTPPRPPMSDRRSAVRPRTVQPARRSPVCM